MGFHGPGWAVDEETNDIQAWQLMARDVERHVRSSATKRQTKWAIEKPKLDNAMRLRGIYFIDPADEEFKYTITKARRQLESSDASSNALQDQGKNVQGIYEKAFGRNSTQGSWRPYCRESNQIIEPLQSCAQVYSYAKSCENTRCESSSGQRTGKIEKILAWQLTKVRSKIEVIDEARKEGKTVHFASSMDIWHLKNSESEPTFQKYKGRVVLRGNSVQVDSGSYAVFTEQGSSASQMRAAKVMDILSRLSGCAGQAADAEDAYTQLKMEDAPTLLKIPKSECPDMWIRLPKHNWPKSCFSMEDPVVLLERNLYGHPLAGLLWETEFEKVLLEHGWEKVPNWECFFVKRDKGPLARIRVCGRFQTASKKQNIDPMWKVLMKEVDLGEQRYCGKLQKYVWIQNLCRSKRKTALFQETRRRHLFVVLRYGRSCKEMCGARYCELANKTPQQLYKVTTPCLDAIISKKKNWDLLEKWCIWHALVDQAFYGQWTNLHDRFQNGPKPVTNAWIDLFHTFITHVNTNNIVMWVILQNNADWDCFRTLTLREILKIQNRLQGNFVHIWKSHVCSHKLDV